MADKTPYGDVEYADPGYQEDGQKRYPLDTEEHCRAAWSYINQEKNASKYTPEQLDHIKSRIKEAAKKYGIKIDEDTHDSMMGNQLKFARPVAMLREGRTDWYKIENRADVTEISIYDEIGYVGVTASNFIRDLNGVKSGQISLRLNSPGGDVFDGIAIMNALRNHPANVTVHIDGLAASIASVIAMGGDHIVMAPNAQMMIHDAHTIQVGNAADLRKTADLLDKASDNIASVYANRAGGSIENWRDVMRDETWFSAEEAVAAGLADEVQGSASKVKNTWDLSIYNHAGRENAPAPQVVKEEQVAEVEIDAAAIIEALKEAFNND